MASVGLNAPHHRGRIHHRIYPAVTQKLPHTRLIAQVQFITRSRHQLHPFTQKANHGRTHHSTVPGDKYTLRTHFSKVGNAQTTSDIERFVQTLKQPSAYTNTRYSLLDAGHALAWSSTKVARALHDATGQSFKDVLTHYRRNHFDLLTLDRPDLSKLERLKQSGFASYANLHYAERRSTS
jgi:hypothetical protein